MYDNRMYIEACMHVLLVWRRALITALVWPVAWPMVFQTRHVWQIAHCFASGLRMFHNLLRVANAMPAVCPHYCANGGYLSGSALEFSVDVCLYGGRLLPAHHAAELCK